jgi:hypothetical protein
VRIRFKRKTDQPADEVELAPEPSRDPAPQEPSPRTWNLWELERLAEGLNGGAEAEERALLLLHLREFADTSGQLPPQFDPLVRDVFGELVS